MMEKRCIDIVLESQQVVEVGTIDTWITHSGELVPKEHLCFE